MRKRGNGSTAPASSPGAAGKREFRGAMKNPPPPPTGAPSTLKVPNTASISDLSLDERAKIGRLVERLVQARDASERLTAENERLKESHTEAVAGIHAENISLQHENAELREKFSKALGLLKVYQGKIHALEAEVVRGSEIEEQAMRLEQTKSERSVTLEAKAAAQAARARSLEEEVQRLNRVCSELRQKQVGLQRAEQRASAAAASREQQLDSIEQREAAHRRLEELHRAHSAKKKANSAARSAHAAAALRASASGTAPLPQPPALMRLNALAEPSARRRRTPERALRPSPARMTRKTRTPSRTPPTRTRTPPQNQTKTPPRSASRRTPPRSETPRRAVASALGALQQGQHFRQHQRQHDGASSAFSPRSMFSMESRSYDASLLDLVDLVDEVVERERSVLGSPSDAASTRSGGGGGGGGVVDGRGWGGQNARDDALAPASAARTLTPDSVPRSISSFYAPPRDGVPEQSLTLWNDSSGDEYRDDDDAYGNDDDRDDDDDSQDELETHGRGKGSFSPWRPAGVKRR